ncbi:2-hydroxyacid dehydrogenase [Pseudorhizobium flavum]|uniref:Glyoxylate/hydroxypyruvate reductase A n=1 Tax=Pseudorhizobium flavum TaxID=1335061 RepID=A0A7X0DD62_9HYPH|nr:glyoxylate/hydroxypyruvate reductase A [Pseudorhizobium flavum]MBB6180497.1 glyoxylate/hydroxypyruvate reductase A [Pseudorhizobium flavum]CAD6595705.1 glyoxylate/hydroxypyruvate reductase A [Pseudorhizobium flavum]
MSSSKPAVVIDLKFQRREIDAALSHAFRGRKVMLAADKDQDLSSARYAVVWKPDRDLFLRAANLQVLFSGGAGVDHILTIPDLPPIPIVRFVDESLTTRMSEWVVLQCLSHLRQAPAYLRQQREHLWRELPQPEAKDVTVGIMGLGVLGRDSAAKLKMMGFNVIGWSRRAKDIEDIDTFDNSGLDDFLSRTDILVGLLPLTPDTRALFNAGLFRKLRRGGALGGPVFINAGRGGSQVERDLLEALGNGTLRGASLDVFEVEPLPADSPFWRLENVIITPHAASATDVRALLRHVEQQIDRYETNQPMQHVVDRTVGY